MRPAGPTFWLLDGRTRRDGWPTGAADGVGTDALAGVRLAAEPGGRLGLEAPDGSLGQLVVPRWLAFDGAGRAYLLAPSPPWLHRRALPSRRFVPLPATGRAGAGARDLSDPRSIAAAGRRLYVADRGNRRVQLFDTESLALVALWEPRDEAGRRVASDHPDAWLPEDVAATPDGAYVLDSAHGRVLRHRAGTPHLEDVTPPTARGRTWSRVAVDRSGRVHLLEPAGEGRPPRLHAFARDRTPLGTSTDPGPLRDRFDPPPVVTDDHGRFRLPEHPCEGAAAPPGRVSPTSAPEPLRDRTGAPAHPEAEERPAPRAFVRTGTWTSTALDSRIYRCRWHRVVADVGALPAGTRLRVSTYTAPDPLDVAELRPEQWDLAGTFVGRVPAQPGEDEGPPRADIAVRSREGRYLWVRLELSGDGHATPSVGALRVHYPRDSWTRYLPAVYSSDDTGRDFLERFLAVLQTQVEPVEHLIRDMPALFDPAAAPPAMLDTLASWLAVPREGDWDLEQRRRLLAAVPQLLRSRGTPAALQRYLRAYLSNLAGTDVPDDHFPRVVEGFRERRYRWLTPDAPLGGQQPLWSPANVGRVQLDRRVRADRARLVSTGDPDRDVFHHHAHRFRVLVPSVWVRTAADERMIRRAIEAEKPAHTTYELELVGARLRVGVQSRVGLDTIIGATPATRLACRHHDDAAPARPPTTRLGYDTVLQAGARRRTGPRVGAARLPVTAGAR